MDPLPRPTDVNAIQSKAIVELTWSDGHKSSYPFDYLRGHCPCAGCQGHGGSHNFHPADGEAARLSGMQQVGSYALCMKFADGHDSGLYTYEHLLKICPCDEHGGPGYNPENIIGI